MQVLLIEDSPDFARSMVILLGRAGCEVTWTATGAEALATVERDAFDVIISDLWLSDTDGLTLMRKLQNRHPCPAIALSGDFIPGQMERLAAAGFSTFARKPVDIDTLMLLMRRLVGPVPSGMVDIAPAPRHVINFAAPAVAIA
jgi:CheY-like chemotaxis protein